MRMAGIAAADPDVVPTPSSRRSTSAAFAGRDAGSLARHCITSDTSSAGQSGRASATDFGVSLMWATTSLCGGRSGNGPRPAISSYAIAPNA